MYALGDCFIFASYPKEWLDSENEDWYTPTPEIFHVVTKDGTVLSEIYFQGNVECCVPISEERFIVVSGRYMEREWDYDYEEEGDENCCDYCFHQLEVYDKYGNAEIRKNLYQEKKRSTVSVAVAEDGSIYYTNGYELHITKDFNEEQVYKLDNDFWKKSFVVSKSGKRLLVPREYGQYVKLDEIHILEDAQSSVLLLDENDMWFEYLKFHCYGSKIVMEANGKLYAFSYEDGEGEVIWIPSEKRQVRYLLKEEEVTKKYGLQDYTLSDKRIGYDGNLYFLYRREMEKEYSYQCIKFIIEWTNGNIGKEQKFDLGMHPFCSSSFVPLLEDFLLYGAVVQKDKGRSQGCENFSNLSHILLNRKGKLERTYRFGYAGMHHTDREGNIYIGYSDDMAVEGPIERNGVNVCNASGLKIWANPFKDMYVNYASNMSESGRYWYLYYTGNFRLVGTDLRGELLCPQIDLRGCDAFVVNADDTKFLFDGGYEHHDSFYEYDFDHTQGLLSNKTRIHFYYGKEPVKFRKVETGGSKMAFFGEDGVVYIYKM